MPVILRSVPAALVAALLTLSAASPSPAATGTGSGEPQAIELSAAQREDIRRIEAYLNDIDTLQARFVQLASTGDMASGTLYLDRPGKLRIDYDPPSPVLILADGTWLIYVDQELGQTTHLGLDDSPAGLLVRERVSLLGDDLMITGLEAGASVLRVTLRRTSDPLGGSMTLVFADKPLQLRKWTVIDAQGVSTDFALVEPRRGVTLDPELFRYEAPDRDIDRR